MSYGAGEVVDRAAKARVLITETKPGSFARTKWGVVYRTSMSGRNPVFLQVESRMVPAVKLCARVNKQAWY